MENPIVVLYFGAGRGPLIRSALEAARRAEVEIKVIALDKNPLSIKIITDMIKNENL